MMPSLRDLPNHLKNMRGVSFGMGKPANKAGKSLRQRQAPASQAPYAKPKPKY